MARKKKPEEHVNHERWLVSYADFITLLFAFFTSLYAISTVDSKKAGKMVFSTRAAFNMEFFTSQKPVLGQSSSEAPQAVKVQVKDTRPMIDNLPKPKSTTSRGGGPSAPLKSMDTSARNVKILANDLKNFLKENNLKDKVSVRLSNNGLIVSITEAALFKAGDTELRQETLKTFDAIISKLVLTGHQINIEGHTDNQASTNKLFRSNWALSTARAVNVVNYLIEEYAYPPDMLSAAGYSEYRPIAPNDSAAGRALNRRIDIILKPREKPHPLRIVN